MLQEEIKPIIKKILEKMPADWLKLTTHRLDIYNEPMAKTEFLMQLEALLATSEQDFEKLPTAYDYIRLGHPLSCVLEWAMAKSYDLKAENVIAFSSQTMPLFAVLRRNKFLGKATRVLFQEVLPSHFDAQKIHAVYDYQFELQQVESFEQVDHFDGITIAINAPRETDFDFNLNLYPEMGSMIVINTKNGSEEYIKEIQHVRRRESIAMTPFNCLRLLQQFTTGEIASKKSYTDKNCDTSKLLQTISEITSSQVPAVIGNCGLSVQYAIMMGLIEYANVSHQGRRIYFIVPPNCYGGTNDQARRVAACLEHVEIIDLPVDSGKDMVNELERILEEVAHTDGVPYIIAEIPTNPRVEIPDLEKLLLCLNKVRSTQSGTEAIEPVFILDQTFCPNVKFFGDEGYLEKAKVIAYVSGSKFPSGGLCTAGYGVANENAKDTISYVDQHLKLCGNSATELQIEILTQEMPSMNERILKAYENTRAFVDYIQSKMPTAKINFVSKELALAGFTPSVFSMDLHNQEHNHTLINLMINEIPQESKHCVSYGQLKGCYWTIPATSTQGTTKEADKDYIVRVSVAPEFNLKKHQEVFDQFLSVVRID